jgi:hypothetical protein
LVVICVALVGCASAGVSHTDLAPTAQYSKPNVIYYSVNTSSGEWKNASADASNDWPNKVDGWFNEILPQELGNIASARPYSGSPRSGWLVETSVTYFDPGSATARLWIGGGAGQSKIKTLSEVYDLARSSTSPIFSFDTYGDSGNYSSLYEQASVGTGPKKDIWRTCREIRGYLENVTGIHGH